LDENLFQFQTVPRMIVRAVRSIYAQKIFPVGSVVASAVRDATSPAVIARRSVSWPANFPKPASPEYVEPPADASRREGYACPIDAALIEITVAFGVYNKTIRGTAVDIGVCFVSRRDQTEAQKHFCREWLRSTKLQLGS